jgi:hypothetical protein
MNSSVKVEPQTCTGVLRQERLPGRADRPGGGERDPCLQAFRKPLKKFHFLCEISITELRGFQRTD